MSQTTQSGAISAPKKELLRGTIIAAIVAGVILAVAVLPAEYGIDPTGIGKKLGLTAMHHAAAATLPEATPVSAPATSATSAKSTAANPSAPARKPSTVAAPGEERVITVASAETAPYRIDTMEIILAPGKGLEVKTSLAKGATLIYSWKTKGGEVLNHDFHDEPLNAKHDSFESSILEGNVSESRGSLIAPLYWRPWLVLENKNNTPVTVVLNASGF